MPSTARRTTRARRSPKLPAESQSLWIATTRYPRFEPLAGDLRVDVAIVGAGITGLTAAYLLKAAGKRVAVLDASRVAQGVTGYTTAHLTEVVDASFGTLISHFGEDDAREAVAATRASLERIGSLVRERDIACDFRTVPGYYFTEKEDAVEQVREEVEAARRLGLRVSLLDAAPLPFPTRAAFRIEDQARFHVRKYLRSLLDAIPGDGSSVFEETRVLDVDDGTPCRVRTERGVVTADDVIVATHVPLSRLLLQTKLAHYRSYVLACRVEGEVPEGLFWDTEDPYHYLRPQEVKGETLLIAGGADHKVGQEEDTESCYEEMLEYVSERFKVRSVPYRWSAQVAEPVDGLAFIGRHPVSAHLYVGTGYSGTGMTFGTLTAMICSDLILGRENRWARLFDATRVKPIAAAKTFVAENVDFPAHLVGDRLKKADETYRSVVRGRGKVVEVDGRRVAAYRDEEGAIHAVSPVCTHLGCLVGFNDAEKSWDCPCHGSRFSTDGTVINGPAVKALEKIEG